MPFREKSHFILFSQDFSLNIFTYLFNCLCFSMICWSIFHAWIIPSTEIYMYYAVAKVLFLRNFDWVTPMLLYSPSKSKQHSVHVCVFLLTELQTLFMQYKSRNTQSASSLLRITLLRVRQWFLSTNEFFSFS